jgi:hypothetical protein
MSRELQLAKARAYVQPNGGTIDTTRSDTVVIVDYVDDDQDDSQLVSYELADDELESGDSGVETVDFHHRRQRRPRQGSVNHLPTEYLRQTAHFWGVCVPFNEHSIILVRNTKYWYTYWQSPRKN